MPKAITLCTRVRIEVIFEIKYTICCNTAIICFILTVPYNSNSGLAAIIPFYMTMTEQFGASPAMIGIMYSTLPFVFLFSKPLCGALADKFQQKKNVLLTSLLIMYGGTLATYFIPLDIQRVQGLQPTELMCDSTLGLVFPCLQHQQQQDLNISSEIPLLTCNFSCQVISRDDAPLSICRDSRRLCPDGNVREVRSNVTSLGYRSRFQAAVKVLSDTNFTDVTNMSICQVQQQQLSENRLENSCGNAVSSIPCEISCVSNDTLASSRTSSKDGADVYRLTPQIITFWFCLAISGIGISIEASVGDAVIIGLLKKEDDFGRQRLWGSISWGIVSLVSSYLVDVASKDKPYKDFTPSYCIVLVASVLHVLIIILIRVEESEKPAKLFKKVSGLFRKPQVAHFTLAVFFAGILTGPVWTFILVFLNDLGAPQLLIGVSVCIQCFVGEVPFYFFSDWFLRKIGYSYTMILVLATLGLRMLMYSLITDPWTVLPAELTQGITFSLFYAALVTYPNNLAPPCFQATLQGIFQGIFEGLGKQSISSFVRHRDLIH